MKLSKAEFLIVMLTAAVLAFSAGWFVHSRMDARPLRVTVEHPFGETAVTVTLPPSTPAPARTPAPAPKLEPGQTIDINTAGEEELVLLPGIGQQRARDIVADRAANGPFRIPEDLTRVPGIGEGTLAGLIDYITVGGTE